MSLLASFIAALERTGGERLVLRSGEPPHLLVGNTRRDLGTATVSNKALAALTAQILSAEAQQTFAETNAADEPLTLTGALSSTSLFVEARRSGSDTSITLRRTLPQPAAAVAEQAPAAPVAHPAPAALVPEPAPAALVAEPAPAAAVVEPAPPAVHLPPAPAEPVVAPAEQTKHVPEPDEPSEWEQIDLAAEAVKAAAVVESEPTAAADQPVAMALAEAPPEPTAVIADTVPTFVDALKSTGSDRLVFRSGEPPHLLVGEIRHNLDAATVSNQALETLAAQILSADGQRTFAETNGAVEPLGGAVSNSPLLVEARRTGNEIWIELRRSVEAGSPAAVLTPVEPAPIPVSTVSAPPTAVDVVSAPPAQVEPFAISAEPMEHIPAPDEPSEWEATDIPAAGLETATVLEPEPVPAAAPPTAGPVRIVAFPPQEPKANVVDAVPAKTGPAPRRDTNALEYWIRQAAQRDATALYLRGGQAPVMRLRERVEQLPGDPLDGSFINDVTAAFAANDDEWHAASDGGWVREYDGVGEVRCQAFTDERGSGLVVHLSAASTLQKNIPRQVRQACEEDDGIVLVSAETAADVLAMVAAVAQWTAQKRAGYLISVEPPNGLGHDISGTFVSARRIDGPPENVAAAIRQAVQQRPDILVVALPTGLAAEEAIRAARPGCLMILGVVAPTAPRALESLLSLVNPHVEPQMRRSLAAGLRCGFSYRTLRRIGGGRTIVHDVLVASREVRDGLGQWDFGALDKLQRSGVGGMRSLDAALARAVHRGEISLRQAAMHAVNRGAVVSLVRQASRDRARMSREERPGGLRAVAGASGTQTL